VTPAEHRRQVADVRASLALADSRADRRDGPLRLVPPVKPPHVYTLPIVRPL
jgi:hypothetical protein